MHDKLVAGGFDAMNVNEITPNEIRQCGLDAVRRELGLIGLARFLQQFERGNGDYTKERHEWLPQGSVREVVAELEKNTPPKRDE